MRWIFHVMTKIWKKPIKLKKIKKLIKLKKQNCDKKLINNFWKKISLVLFYKAETQIPKPVLIKKNRDTIN